MGWKMDIYAESCHLFMCVVTDPRQQERPTKGEGFVLYTYPFISSCLFIHSDIATAWIVNKIKSL